MLVAGEVGATLESARVWVNGRVVSADPIDGDFNCQYENEYPDGSDEETDTLTFWLLLNDLIIWLEFPDWGIPALPFAVIVIYEDSVLDGIVTPVVLIKFTLKIPP